LLCSSYTFSQVYSDKLKISQYTFKTYDGKEYPCELGRLNVPENRKNDKTNFIEIAFVRFKSLASTSNSPIIFLAGGPGIPGIGLAQVPVYFSLFNELRKTHDVILLDQRGTGLSTPALVCPKTEIPFDAFENEQKFTKFMQGKAGYCSKSWKSKGVDITGYTTESIADDMEELRKALGIAKYNLLGWSYGTELALSYIRKYEKNVDRSVFLGTRGPNNLLKLPSVWDFQLKKISFLIQKDSIWSKLLPDFELSVQQAFQKLEELPLKIIVTNKDGQSKEVLAGKIALQAIVRADLSDLRTVAKLPSLIYSFNNADYSQFNKRVEALYNGFNFSLMGLCVDCATGATKERSAIAEKEKLTALLSNVNLQWSAEICKAAGSKPLVDNFRTRISSNVPSLFITGTLDTNTPSFQAEEVRWGFPDSKHIIIENAGHETIPSQKVQEIISSFFEGKELNEQFISVPKLAFAPYKPTVLKTE